MKSEKTENKNKPLSGRESSVLALIAQSKKLSKMDKSKILASLDGRALKIAKAMLGYSKNFSKSILKAAEGFKKWAKK
jgi:hypothetical protein